MPTTVKKIKPNEEKLNSVPLLAKSYVKQFTFNRFRVTFSDLHIRTE